MGSSNIGCSDDTAVRCAAMSVPIYAHIMHGIGAAYTTNTCNFHSTTIYTLCLQQQQPLHLRLRLQQYARHHHNVGSVVGRIFPAGS